MSFNPLFTSDNIRDSFRRYILSTFRTNSDVYNQQLRYILSNDDSLARGPYLEISHNFPAGSYIRDLVKEDVLSSEFLNLGHEPFEKYKLYAHQESAVRRVVDGHNIVVSTGTGSGKTECFIIPIINYLMREKEAGRLGPGVRVMLLYPLNALANDQRERMRDILSGYPDITFGTYTGETKNTLQEAKKEDAGLVNRLENELYDRQSMLRTPPNILITNYAMLEHLLIKPESNALFGDTGENSWKFIILDEVHTYTGAKGSEVSMLLRRLRTTLGKNDLQYILTSATLGSRDVDEEVAAFATELCDSEFTVSDIIRSSYIPMVPPENGVSLNREFYYDVSKIVSAPGNDVESELDAYLTNKGYASGKPREILYDLVYNDPKVHDIARCLDDIPLTLFEISERLGILAEDLIDIITTISATKKYGNRIFNAKYHFFVKGLDGAYITLKGSEKFFVKPQKKYKDADSGKEFTVFQISTCYNCKAIYIIGVIENRHLVQVSNHNRISKNGNKALPYLLLNDQAVDQGVIEDEDNTYALCSVCGRITKGKATGCGCGDEYTNLVIKVGEREKVCTCPSCGNKDSRRGLLRQLFLGQDASTSVISSSLYADLLQSRDQRFLCFSDSRQAAAFFAPYLEDTYNGILAKRVIYETMKANVDKLSTNVSFDDFVKMVKNTVSRYNLEGEVDALNSVILECSCNNSFRSLEYLGFLKFEYGSSVKSWNPCDMPQYGLNMDQVYNIINMILKNVRDKRSVQYGSTDFIEYDYRRSVVLNKVPGRDGKLNHNQLSLAKQMLEYVMQLIPDEDKATEFLNQIIIQMLSPYQGGSLLDLERLSVSIPSEIHVCSRCGTSYPFNADSICPKCCTRTLETKSVCAVEHEIGGKIIPFNLDMNDHYIRNCIESPLHRLRIKEHTAQLGRSKAASYQKLFKDGNIDALSCSTTFEMGVDIGSLNAVLMRNVPPLPSNYVQRAGRAGRGEDSSAFAITFCREASHDITYYEDPLKMVCGTVNVPRIKVDNPAIVQRHMYAAALNFFWREMGEYPGDVSRFVEQYPRFTEYLRSEPDELKQYLLSMVPESLIDSEGGIDVSSFGWVKDLIDGDDGYGGRLGIAMSEFSKDNEILDEPFRIASGGGITSKKEMVKMLQMATSSMRTQVTISEDDTIDFLSRHNIIPKYGFPTDVVPLVPVRGRVETELNRGLSVAISEFAPGSEIIVDGKKVRSQYVTTIRGGNWVKYRYKTCEVCSKTTTVIDNSLGEDDASIGDELKRCSCGNSLEHIALSTFIRPDLGFKYVDSPMKVSEKPSRTYSSGISFCESYDQTESTHQIGNESVQLIPRSNGKMVTINTTMFGVCERCGYADRIDKVVGSKDCTHKAPNGKDCSRDLTLLNLGNRFNTDLLIVRFVSKPCRDYNTAISVMYALTEGLCRENTIERNEVNCCLDNIDGDYAFIIFDNTPGGSGYVKGIDNEAEFMKIMRAARAVVEGCTCGGESGDSACYGCLKNFNNQRDHDNLVRGLALDYFKSLDLGW